MLHRIRRRLTFANVVALLALFVALGGSSFAEPVRDGAMDLIRGRHIGSDAVGSRHLRSDAVTGHHVDDGSLTSADVRNNVLRARDLRAGVAATDVLGTARLGRGARGAAVGRTPVRASQARSGMCNTLGQVVLFGGDFAPVGTAAARGQLLRVNQYLPLFSIYGARFGGDGQNNFALPDLRGAEPKGQGDQSVSYLVCLVGDFPQRPPE
jgi:Phage Tail Collar Domain